MPYETQKDNANSTSNRGRKPIDSGKKAKRGRKKQKKRMNQSALVF